MFKWKKYESIGIYGVLQLQWGKKENMKIYMCLHVFTKTNEKHKKGKPENTEWVRGKDTEGSDTIFISVWLLEACSCSAYWKRKINLGEWEKEKT